MKVTVTAGHGAGDPGATRNGYAERDLMVELRDIVALKLRELGHDVRTDGHKGQNLSLAEAMKLIYGSDVALELHTNSVESPKATGVEVFSLPAHKQLSQSVAKSIAEVLGLALRGDKGWKDQSQADRGSLGFVRAGGLLVEVFFLSNQSDLNKYLAKRWLVASAITKAVTA